MKRTNLTVLILILCILPTIILADVSGNMQNEEELFKTKNRDWTIIATYPIPEGASGLAYDGTYLYCGIYGANGDEFYRIDPNNGNYELLFTNPNINDSYGMTYDGQYLWITDHITTPSVPATAIQLDFEGNIISQFDLPAHYMSGIAYDNSDFWVSAYYDPDGEIYKVDNQGNVITQFPAPDNQPWDLCMENNNLWMADYWGDALYKIDPTSGTLLETHPSEGTDPAGIVWDGQYLWYCDNGQGSNDYLYKVDLGGGGTPQINIPITEHDFGMVTIGDTATWNCTVENNGTADLEIQNVVINDPYISCNLSFPIYISPGNQTDIPFAYAPLSIGQLNTIVTVQSNDPITPAVDITLTGNAVSQGAEIYLPEDSHNYGLIRAGAYTRWLMTVINNGDEELIISNIISDDDHFFVDQNVNYPINIPVLDTIEIGIWFHPEQAISYSATLTIYSNDPQGTYDVSVEGIGEDIDYPIGTVLWQYQSTTSHWDKSFKAIIPFVDITGDGVPEVIACSEDYRTRCFNGNSSGIADVLWEHRTDLDPYRTGSVYRQPGLTKGDDFNGDGIDDIVIGTTGGSRSIIAISGIDGETIWTHDTHEYGGGGWVYQVDCTYDYNGDGIKDVLSATGDDGASTGPQRIYCLNGLDGISIWERPMAEAMVSVIGINDVTGDDIPDVVAGNTPNSGDGKAYGIDGSNGNILWNFPVPGIAVWGLCNIDDLNGDDCKDVAIGDFSGNLYGLETVGGNSYWQNSIGSYILITHLIELGDVNGNGHPDIIVANSGNYAPVIDGYTGDIIWTQYIGDNSLSVGRIADVSGDFVDDVLIGSLNDNYYFLDGTSGTPLHSANLGEPVDAMNSIPDIVGDNSMEMVAGGRDGLIKCISGGLNAGTEVDENMHIIPLTMQLYQNYPNPFNPETNIRFSLQRDERVSLIIYNIKGQCVKSIYNNAQLCAGFHDVKWNGTDNNGESVGSGIYLYKLRTEGDSITRKMLMLK